MPCVGETYEQNVTGIIFTVVKVTKGSFGWPQRVVPRIALMVVVPNNSPSTLYPAGCVIHETTPTGELESYGYTRLA